MLPLPRVFAPIRTGRGQTRPSSSLCLQRSRGRSNDAPPSRFLFLRFEAGGGNLTPSFFSLSYNVSEGGAMLPLPRVFRFVSKLEGAGSPPPSRSFATHQREGQRCPSLAFFRFVSELEGAGSPPPSRFRATHQRERQRRPFLAFFASVRSWRGQARPPSLSLSCNASEGGATLPLPCVFRFVSKLEGANSPLLSQRIRGRGNVALPRIFRFDSKLEGANSLPPLCFLATQLREEQRCPSLAFFFDSKPEGANSLPPFLALLQCSRGRGEVAPPSRFPFRFEAGGADSPLPPRLSPNAAEGGATLPLPCAFRFDSKLEGADSPPPSRLTQQREGQRCPSLTFLASIQSWRGQTRPLLIALVAT